MRFVRKHPATIQAAMNAVKSIDLRSVSRAAEIVASPGVRAALGSPSSNRSHELQKGLLEAAKFHAEITSNTKSRRPKTSLNNISATEASTKESLPSSQLSVVLLTTRKSMERMLNRCSLGGYCTSLKITVSYYSREKVRLPAIHLALNPTKFIETLAILNLIVAFATHYADNNFTGWRIHSDLFSIFISLIKLILTTQVVS